MSLEVKVAVGGLGVSVGLFVTVGVEDGVDVKVMVGVREAVPVGVRVEE